ncbi:hypothetical protein PIROE2DRAFT_14948 [Piromyces sp. E2]|nr:hypothetical protein PIROE2DRAFT_14948 [Piromyces sp. E2]|eukprot:OUM59497.1 hypothetical protein PIROE2DRAFT_14948 [Piromyces sp. E2]
MYDDGSPNELKIFYGKYNDFTYEILDYFGKYSRGLDKIELTGNVISHIPPSISNLKSLYHL